MPSIAETITVGDDGFGFPTSELLTGRGFITGKSGAGKSNSSNVVAEELLELGLPFVIVDIEGEYWGLKEEYDIVRAGRGDEVDEPFTHEEVPYLVDVVLEDTTALILDLSGIPDPDEVDDLLWDFVSHLFERENDARKPCLLFVEELHEFLPQSGGHDDLAELLVRVAKRGRKRGLGILGLSQRPAAVDKEFITQCDWIVWHRLTWENDVSVVSQILGSEAADEVQDLETGEALVMTDWDEEVTRVKFRRKHTFDAGATPDLSSFAEDEIQPRRQSASGTSSSTDSGSTSTGSGGGSGSTKSSGSSGGSGSSRSKSKTNGGATTSRDAGPPEDPEDFDPIQEVALLAAYGVGGLATAILGGLRAARALPAASRRVTPAGSISNPLSADLTVDGLERRDRWLSVAVALLVLAGVALIAVAVLLWLGGA